MRRSSNWGLKTPPSCGVAWKRHASIFELGLSSSNSRLWLPRETVEFICTELAGSYPISALFLFFIFFIEKLDSPSMSRINRSLVIPRTFLI